MPENDSTPIDKIIGTVNATDLDGDILTYSVENVTGSPMFEMVNGGRDIQFKGPLLDYESSTK